MLRRRNFQWAIKVAITAGVASGVAGVFFVSRDLFGGNAPSGGTPRVAITLRRTTPGRPIYALQPFDVTIEVRNMKSTPYHCSVFLFSSSVMLDLHRHNIWRIWSPDGTERMIASPGKHPEGGLTGPWPPCPEVQPGEVHEVRQILRLMGYQGLLVRRTDNRPTHQQVFIFPTSGTYVTELESTNHKVHSNRLTIEVREPVGRDREAYDYLLSCKYPYFVCGHASYRMAEERAEAEEFLARFSDTIYAPYVQYYLSVVEARRAANDLSTSGTVAGEDFMRTWNDLLARRDFLLWPWVLAEKANYLNRLARRVAIGTDPKTGALLYRPTVRLGQTLTAEQSEAIWDEAQAVRETLKKQYPYFP